MRLARVRADEEGEDLPKGGVSDRAKGIAVGAVGTLAVVGLVYAITRQEEPRPKAHPPHAKKPVDAGHHHDEAELTPGEPEEAEVEVIETENAGGVQVTTVLKDIGTVSNAVKALATLEPVAEALIALL